MVKKKSGAIKKIAKKSGESSEIERISTDSAAPQIHVDIPLPSNFDINQKPLKVSVVVRYDRRSPPPPSHPSSSSKKSAKKSQAHASSTSSSSSSSSKLRSRSLSPLPPSLPQTPSKALPSSSSSMLIQSLPLTLTNLRRQSPLKLQTPPTPIYRERSFITTARGKRKR